MGREQGGSPRDLNGESPGASETQEGFLTLEEQGSDELGFPGVSIVSILLFFVRGAQDILLVRWSSAQSRGSASLHCGMKCTLCDTRGQHRKEALAMGMEMMSTSLEWGLAWLRPSLGISSTVEGDWLCVPLSPAIPK